MEIVVALACLTVTGGFYLINQGLVDHKNLDPRPWYAPSWWGPVGTVMIILAKPVGWKRR